MKYCLNLGCGNDIRKSTPSEKWINCDVNRDDVESNHNLNNLPYPFRDNEFDVVYASHILEHLKPSIKDIWEELYRMIKPGGKLVIRIPHFSSCNAFSADHSRFFRALDFLEIETNSSLKKRFSSMFKLKVCRLKIYPKTKKYLPYNYIVEFFFNLDIRLILLYERSFLFNLFPFDEVYIELEKSNKKHDNTPLHYSKNIRKKAK